METTILNRGILFFVFYFTSLFVLGQAPDIAPVMGSNPYIHSQVQCLNNYQRLIIWDELNVNIQKLKSENKLHFDANRPASIQFGWPLKMSDDVGYNKIWGISNYVDQQSEDGMIDFNCGTRTYSGHKGTDFFLWPFPWYAMDFFQAENVAAADGQIIAKHDGEFDRSCAMNSNVWNAVYLQHADGSITWYGHMKKGTLTSKGVGDMVLKGEFLGNTGSSGSSTAPHLHFEVYDANGNLIDPYQGDCNILNNETWWEDQKPYIQPSINAVFTHSEVFNFNDCPEQETLNLSNEFEPNDQAVFSVFLTDQTTDTSVHLEIIKPNGTHLYDWEYVFDQSYAASYLYWTINLTEDEGNWIWRVTYGDDTISHEFQVHENLSLNDNEIQTFEIFPNPAHNFIYFKSNHNILEVIVMDLSGKVVIQEKNKSGIRRMDIDKLAEGLYLMKMKDQTRKTAVLKLIKKNKK